MNSECYSTGFFIGPKNSLEGWELGGIVKAENEHKSPVLSSFSHTIVK